MVRIFRTFAAFSALILLAGFMEADRTLSGVVTDRHSRPIPEAAVQIENERTLSVQSCITDERGQFHFSELSPDADYDLQAQFDGIRSRKRVLSQFDSHPHAGMKLVIRLPRQVTRH